jgi:hypothetical protein
LLPLVDIAPLLLNGSLFPELGLLAGALPIDVTPTVLMPPPEGLFSWGRLEELPCPDIAQPGRNNSHAERNLMGAEYFAQGVEGASTGPDIIRPEENGWEGNSVKALQF